jgi:anti-sigma factor RsiW
MIHIDDGVLRAFLDGELPSSDAQGVHAHIDGCAACRARRDELDRAAAVVSGALALLGAAVPAPDAWRRVDASLRPAPRATKPMPWARAAAIVLLMGGGLTAALVPGSPVRSLWSPAAPAVETPSAATVSSAMDEAGIRSTVTSTSAEIALRAPSGVEIEIVRGGERTGVFGPPDASFRLEGERLVAESEAGPLRVELPQAVLDARVSVNGVDVVELRGGELTTAPPSLEAGERTLVRFRVR